MPTRIASGAGEQSVPPAAPDQHIRATFSAQGVIPSPAQQLVLAAPTEDHIVAAVRIRALVKPIGSSV